MLAISRAHPLWSSERMAQARVETAIAALPEEDWERLSVGCGSKGPRVYDWAIIRFPVMETGEWMHGMLARRSLSDPTAIAYYRVFAPVGTQVEMLARVAGTRWTIAIGFERAKGEVGLDEYEVRRWEAWHRHPAQRAPTLALLADAYLAVTRMHAVAREKKGAVHTS